MFDLIIQHARLCDGTGHPSLLGRRASRTAASHRAGCEFSVVQMLLVWAKVEGKRVIRRQCARKKAAHFMAQRRPGMRLITMVFGPYAPNTQTSWPSIFSFYFNGLQRFPKLATSSIQEQHTPQRPVSPIDMVPTLACPLLALFGEEDPNPSPVHADRLQAQLDKHGKTYESRMYRNAGHAFFADYRPSYRAAAAQDMWHRVLVFYEQYLAA